MAAAGDGATEEEQRRRLAQQLDDELQAFVASRKRRQPTAPTVDEIEKEVKEHPLFINELPENGELPPLVEALQSLKYDPDENSPEELAQSYKEDGNFHFKVKKYNRAIDAYTEGLKQNCGEMLMVVQLHTNRAAAHYHLGNFRKAHFDCQAALKLKPDHMKAIIRGAQCCCELGLCSEALDLCEQGLKEEAENAALLKLKQRATKEKKIQGRDKRKAALAATKQQTDDRCLLAAIKSRHLKLAELEEESDTPSLEFLQPTHPAASRVMLDEHDGLSWPVLFMYPEHLQTELVQAFNENRRFADHLAVMFSSDGEPPEWDVEEKYKVESLKVFYESSFENVLIGVDAETTLLETLQDDQYVIRNGTPAFIILVGGSEFQERFFKRYDKIKHFSTNSLNKC